MVFKVYDIDKNGRINANEIRKIIEAIYDFLGDDINCKIPAEVIVSKVMEKLGLISDIFIIAVQIKNFFKLIKI
jgi:Ca2+-binding EF-hand superfamily protein